MSGRVSMMVILALALLAGFSTDVWADTFLEEFEGGLSGWTYTADVSTGPVTPGDGASAVLTAATPDSYYDRLYRPLELGTGTLTFEFDFLNGVNNLAYEGSVFSFSGLYFVDSLIGFEPGVSFDDILVALDLEASSVDPHSGSVSDSAIEGWQHYSITFLNTHRFIIPAFDLQSSSQTTAAFLRIDNVRISGDAATVVPLPRAAYMAGAGIVGLLLLGGTRRRKLSQ